MACGSCHFHAGADSRIKNQLSPGGKSTPENEQLFDHSISGQQLGSNYTLKKSDFPFHQRENPVSKISPISFTLDDAVSSSGTFSGEFNSVSRRGMSHDDCSRGADSVFPCFQHRNQKGRAPKPHPLLSTQYSIIVIFGTDAPTISFNGSSSWGERDPGCRRLGKNQQPNSHQTTLTSNQHLQLLHWSVAPPLKRYRNGL